MGLTLFVTILVRAKLVGGKYRNDPVELLFGQRHFESLLDFAINSRDHTSARSRTTTSSCTE
ncbi:MAG: hypothetical protein WCF90_04840 [Methanomicrobiales archaeon]